MSTKLIALLFLAVTLSIANLSLAQEDAPYVEVVNVSGSAQAIISPASEWADLKEGSVLHAEDSVKTYDASSAEIAFDEDKIVRVEPNSHVTILLNEDEKLELVSGAVYASVKKLPPQSTFVIRTPIAISGARGTDWLTKLEGEEMVVEAFEDMPFVRGMSADGSFLREEVRVGAGYKTVVPRFGQPEKFTKISPQSFDDWQRWKKDMTPRVEKISAIRKFQGRKLGGGINKGLQSNIPDDMPSKKRPGSFKASEKSGRSGALKSGTGLSSLGQHTSVDSKKASALFDASKAKNAQKAVQDKTSVKKREPQKIKCCPPTIIRSGSKSQAGSK